MQEATLAGSKLDRYFHICAFFNSRAEEYEVLTPFYREALDWGEKCLHVVHPERKDEHVARMKRQGIDTEHSIACGHLQVLGYDEAYLEDGRFDQHRMLQTVETVFAATRQAGFPRLRIMGNMEWAFIDVVGADQLIEYEARVNDVLARNRQPAICVYDMAWLTGTMMMDILRCHPLTLIGGVVHENPFYVPPERMLPQLRMREARRRAAAH